MESQKEMVVVKLGTSSLTDKDGQLWQPQFNAVASQVEHLREAIDADVVLVSSAAISAGADELAVDRETYAKDLDGLSMLAAIGQPLLMAKWRVAFRDKAVVGQHLVTPRELEPENIERQAFLDKLAYAVRAGVVPIVNENDAISHEEIKIGDNDRISALIAAGLGQIGAWKAVTLVNLSDIDGFYTGDPVLVDSELLREVVDIEAAYKFAGPSGSKHGSGGAVTKLDAAKIMTDAGYTMQLANARANNAIVRAFRNEIGTHFKPSHVE